MKNRDQNVIVVGVGISGLMHALMLLESGFTVTIIAKGADPRIRLDGNNFSSTHDGGPGRFVSRFEGQTYLGDTPLYPDMSGAFANHVTQGGWLGKYPSELDAFDHAWLKKRFEAGMDKSLESETEDFYIRANGESMQLWQELMIRLPKLFFNANVLNTGILRLYDNAALLAWAIALHKKYGVLERALAAEDVANEYPYFKDACDRRALAGGLEAPGFSFNIHAFVSNLIIHLENNNVQFAWNEEVTQIQSDSHKKVRGILCASGKILSAKHYIVSTGAYASERLYKGTPAEGRVAGVAGRWLYIPSPKNFKRPVKIHGDIRTENGKNFPVIDVNLTQYITDEGEACIAVGGGYAYLGKPPFPNENDALARIDEENERIISRFLRPTYNDALARGRVRKSSETCVRSFTANDVPVKECMRTMDGGLVLFDIGTNTGTTTIAPYTARENAERLLGNGVPDNIK